MLSVLGRLIVYVCLAARFARKLVADAAGDERVSDGAGAPDGADHHWGAKCGEGKVGSAGLAGVENLVDRGELYGD